MKCPVCGKDLGDKKLKFCTGCGNPIKVAPTPSVMNEHNEIHSVPNAGYREVPAKSSDSKILLIIIAVLLVIVAGIGGFLISGKLNKPKQEEAVVSAMKDDPDAGEEEVDDDSNEDEEEMDDDSDFEEEYNDDVTMDYVYNDCCDPNNNLSEDDFERVISEDGSFSFSYPKYIFNEFSYVDNDYYYSYTEDGDLVAYLHIYAVEDPGDAVSLMTYRQQSIVDSLYNHGNKTYVFPSSKDKISFGKDQFVQIVVSGWRDAAQREAEYFCVANDGEKSYYVDFMYPDYDPSNDKEPWDYIVNSVYHLCSFSGSSRARGFENYDIFYRDAY